MYARRIVSKSIDADISNRDPIPLISTKAVSARRKEMMITLENISQRILDVGYSGNIVFSDIFCLTPDLLGCSGAASSKPSA